MPSCLRKYQDVKDRLPLLRKGLACRGFTLIEIMVVILILSVIVAIAVPTAVKTSVTSRRTTCVENLRLLESAKEQCAMANNLKSGGAVYWTDVVPTYLKNTPRCPTDGIYTLNPVGVPATCSLTALGHRL
jgi:prepilin-type N-terminal cleavage/methylation domain-containing protein